MFSAKFSMVRWLPVGLHKTSWPPLGNHDDPQSCADLFRSLGEPTAEALVGVYTQFLIESESDGQSPINTIYLARAGIRMGPTYVSCDCMSLFHNVN